MSEVLTEFPDAVQISGTECAADRAPKIGQSCARGLNGAAQLAFGDSGTIRAGRTGRNPRRSHRDSCTHRKSASRRPEKDKRAGFLRALQKAATRCGASVKNCHVPVERLREIASCNRTETRERGLERMQIFRAGFVKHILPWSPSTEPSPGQGAAGCHSHGSARCGVPSPGSAGAATHPSTLSVRC